MRRRISASTTPLRKISTTSMCRTSDFHQWYSRWFFHYLCYANELRPLIWVYWLDFHEPMIRLINCLPLQKPISVSHYIQFLILEEMTSWRILLLFTIYIIRSFHLCPQFMLQFWIFDWSYLKMAVHIILITTHLVPLSKQTVSSARIQRTL